jgi:hypothetical protein
MQLLFVHGRAQEGRSAEDIRHEWVIALNIGLRKAGRKELSVNPVVPYYGNLLNELSRSLEVPAPSDLHERGPHDDFRQFLQQYAVEVNTKSPVPPERLARDAPPGAPAANLAVHGREDVQERGVENWSWVQAVIRAIDERFPNISSETISLILRDVYVYLTDPRIHGAIDKVVLDAITSEPTVVVAHSLGTVVAYNVLCKVQAAGMARCVTVGSPLGIHAVRERLGTPPSIPASVKTWYNARDRRDVVALNPLLDPFFKTTPVIANNDNVDNVSDNRHNVSHYLDDPAVAAKIADALSS